MPTKQITLTGTAQKIVNADNQRTVLTIANLDATDPGFVSDNQGAGSTRHNSYPIFAETHISMERRQGDQPELAWYGVCEAGKTVVIAILEGYGDIAVPTEESPQQPYAVLDAPRMRRI